VDLLTFSFQNSRLKSCQIEKELIIALLRVSKGRPVLFELVKNELKLPSSLIEKLLEKLQQDGCLYLCNGLVETNTLQRLRLATRALQLGADYERVSSPLEWREFERVTAVTFEEQEYRVETNFHFTQGGHKWEIDVVGCRRPLVVCADCKHWRRGLHPSRLKKAVEEQARRTLAFSEFLPNRRARVYCASWNKAIFVPMVLSLMPVSLKFHNGTPIVPILQVRDFLTQLPMCVDSLEHFDKTWSHFKAVS